MQNTLQALAKQLLLLCFPARCFCHRRSSEEKLYDLHPESKFDFTPLLLSCLCYASPSADECNPLVSEQLVAELCSAVLRITQISQILMQHH